VSASLYPWEELELTDTDISYWKAQTGMVGYLTEVAKANITGGIPVTGKQRQLTEQEIEKARAETGNLTK